MLQSSLSKHITDKQLNVGFMKFTHSLGQLPLIIFKKYGRRNKLPNDWKRQYFPMSRDKMENWKTTAVCSTLICRDNWKWCSNFQMLWSRPVKLVSRVGHAQPSSTKAKSVMIRHDPACDAIKFDTCVIKGLSRTNWTFLIPFFNSFPKQLVAMWWTYCNLDLMTYLAYYSIKFWSAGNTL